MRTLVGEGAEQERDVDSLCRREPHPELRPRSETPNRQSHPGAPSINLMTQKRGQENEIFQFIKELRKNALHRKSSAENEHGQRDREWPLEEAPVHIPGPSGRADLVPRIGRPQDTQHFRVEAFQISGFGSEMDAQGVPCPPDPFMST